MGYQPAANCNHLSLVIHYIQKESMIKELFAI